MWSSTLLLLRKTVRHWILMATGSIASLLGTGAGILNFNVANLPPWVLTLIGLLLLLAAIVRAFHDIRVERDNYHDQLDGIRLARPRLVCCGQKFVPLFEEGTFKFDALQMWICNRPRIRDSKSLAHHVSVRVEFEWDKKRLQLGLQWVNSIDPNAASFSGHSQDVDISANDNPSKFFLILQHSGDNDCYVYSFGAFPGHPDGRDPRYRLPPGQYRVTVFLRGDNVDQKIDWQFVNHGRDTTPEIVGIPKIDEEASPSPAWESDDD